MDRWRTGLAIGVGALAVVAALGGLYQISLRLTKDEEQYSDGEHVKSDKGEKSVKTDKSVKRGKKEDNEEDDYIELSVIPLKQVKHFKALLMGELDAAQWESDDGTEHDILVQYCGYAASVSHKGVPRAPENRLLGHPIGRLLFDDGSAAIIYKGGGGGCSVLGHDGLRFAPTVNALKELLGVLAALERAGWSVPDRTLSASVVVINPAGKIRLLGGHGWQRAKGEGNGSARAFLALAAQALTLVTTDREQARRLTRDLSGLTTLSQIERKLTGHQHH